MSEIDTSVVGKRFGRLVVIGDDGTRTPKGRVKWLCQCDCGNTTHILANSLKKGATKSCGCLNDEKKRSRYKDLSNYENENFKVLEKVYSKSNRVCWKCLCKHCGNESVIMGNKINQTKSCGCLKKGASKEYMKSISDPESLKTTKPTAKSTTGVRGVYYQKKSGTYQAFINVDKKTKYLGSSKSFEKAVALRKAAEKKYGYK